MKNPILFCLSFLFILTINAQWTDSGSSLTTSDNVGIGTTNPTAKFQVHINGNERALRIVNDAYGSQFNFWSNEVNSNKQLRIDEDTNGKNLMTLFQNGNIGIGTTYPTHLLTLNSGTSSDGARALVFEREVSGGAYNDIKAALGISGHTTQGGLRFMLSSDNGTNWNNDAFFLQAGGNVGIGTANPSESLDVARPGIRIGSNSYNLTDQAYIKLYEGANDHGIRFHLNGNTNKFSLISRLHQVDEEVMVIPYWGTNAGNVGIGTNNPDAKLAVNGNIHTKEVKVDLMGWPDYVFEKGYDLPTLEEVEGHIQANGHLKDIPNAMEVEENGVFLGDMEAKLLQKIEELTLYAIQQQKEIKKLQSENKQLKSVSDRLDKLEKLIFSEQE